MTSAPRRSQTSPNTAVLYRARSLSSTSKSCLPRLVVAVKAKLRYASDTDLTPNLFHIIEEHRVAAPRAIVEAARRYVRQHFPDMQGMRCSGEPAPVPGKFIVTARRRQATQDGRMIDRIVRVTLDANGKVLRASASK